MRLIVSLVMCAIWFTLFDPKSISEEALIVVASFLFWIGLTLEDIDGKVKKQ